MAGFNIFAVDYLNGDLADYEDNIKDEAALRSLQTSKYYASSLRQDNSKIENMNTPYFIEGYAIKDPFATHFLTFTVCGWIDLFTRKVYKDILIDALKYAQKQNQLILYAYVIMSNHMHLIARANDIQ